MNVMIRINKLSKCFGNNLVLDDICMDIKKGEITGIIGYNGCGKTVLMKCICGFLPATAGYVEINGKKIGHDIAIPNNIGIILETPGFIKHYSGYENLYQLSKVNNKIGKQQILDAMVTVGLDPNSRKKVGKYSLGMRQRLGLAQAIMENPDILLLDEPMNGLDKDGIKQMRQYFIKLKKQGKTILLASHSSEDIDVLCDTIYEIERGKLIEIR